MGRLARDRRVDRVRRRVGDRRRRGARRTQSSFPAYLRHVNADTLGVITAFDSPGVSNVPYNAGLIAKIARLPLVKQVADFTIVDPEITPLDGHAIHVAPGGSPPNIGGSFDGSSRRWIA